MDRGGDCVEETGVRIGPEIDRDICPRCDRADSLDVQHDLTVGAVRVTGRLVLAVVHRDHGDFWCRLDAKRREVLAQVGVPLAAAKLDDSDAFTLPGFGRKVVERSKLQWSEGRRISAISGPMHVTAWRAGTEMWLCHWPIVETEHGFDATGQFVRQLDASDPPTIRTAGMLKALQIYPKCGVELRDCAGQHHRTPPRVFLNDGEAMLGRKFLDRGDVGGRGTVLLVKFVPGGMAALPLAPSKLLHPVRQLVGVAAPEKHGNFHSLSGIGLPDHFRPRDWSDVRCLVVVVVPYTNSF